MHKTIAIASGKGGTGKTTVALNLFWQLAAKHPGKDVRLADCDVEEPNDLLFLNGATHTGMESIQVHIPEVDTDKCTYCGRCAQWCEYNAIMVVPPTEFINISVDLCHACGACFHACRDGALQKAKHPIAEVNTYKTKEGQWFYEGRLMVGSTLHTPAVNAVRKRALKGSGLLILDAPPGTSCPVVATVSEADHVVLVSEPTPFGLHDLKLAVALMRELRCPFGVVVNKAGIGNRDIYDYLEEENIELLAEIPFSKTYASLYARGLLNQAREKMAPVYGALADKLINTIEQ